MECVSFAVNPEAVSLHRRPSVDAVFTLRLGRLSWALAVPLVSIETRRVWLEKSCELEVKARERGYVRPLLAAVCLLGRLGLLSVEEAE